MTGYVPTFHDLSFYSDPASNKKRYDALARSFKSAFGSEVEFYARSPGRVNLMGDHIDYNFFSVLPMAIDVDVVVAVETTDKPEIVITNTDEKFHRTSILLPSDGSVVQIDQDKFTWASYFTCGLIVAHKFILEKYPELTQNGTKPLKGMKMTFNGTVPTGGGLSSSAAICVASTLAVLRANGLTQISKDDLTRITVVTEHYVGVNTGGMDQCASVYGEPSKALLIQFKPKLTGKAFRFPTIAEDDDLVFLITNSLLVSNKHETAPIHYNLRVVEMGIASDLLASKFGLELPKDSNIQSGSLRGFMDAYFESLGQPKWDGNDINMGIDRLIILSKLVDRDSIFSASEKIGFSTQQAAEALGLPEQVFAVKYLSKFTVRYDTLKLYQRAKHVFEESARVLQCLQLLQEFTHQTGQSQRFLSEFGDIMNKSQHSLDVLHNSSNKQLNSICKIALANGSFGSRVTGAGWGGSVVHLTTASKLSHLKEALSDQYYRTEFPGITDEALAEAVVVSKPAMGSCVVESK